MGIFYTKKGDKGYSYVGKKVIKKTCLEIEALGQLDELNSMIGVVKSLPAEALAKAGQRPVNKSYLKRILHQVQEDLFIIQSHVANLMLGDGFKVLEFKKSKVKHIEKIIDEIECELPPLKKFVISGTNQTSAWLDLLRAKSRNVERSVLKVFESKKVDISNNLNTSNIQTYLNRLSSLFFALARWEARNKKEKNPSYR